MKKIVASLATLAALTSGVNADMLRVEMGGGMWMQTAKGYFQYQKDGIETFIGDDGTATATDKSNEVGIDNGYMWMFIKHPVPVLPNLRVEYSTIESEGTLNVTGEMYGITSSSEPTPTNLKITQMEFIPYYNLLDNTFWVTLDLGVDIKLIHYEANGGEGDVSYDEEGDIPVPLLYLRTRGQIPLTDIGSVCKTIAFPPV